MDPTKVKSFDSNSGGNAGPQVFSENNPTNPSANGDIILVPDAQAQDSKNNKLLTTKMKIMIGIAVVMLIVLGVLAVVLANRPKGNGTDEGAANIAPSTTKQYLNRFLNHVLSNKESIDDVSTEYDPLKRYELIKHTRNYISLNLSFRNSTSDDATEDSSVMDKATKQNFVEKTKQYYDEFSEKNNNDNPDLEDQKNTIELIWFITSFQPDEGSILKALIDENSQKAKEVAMNFLNNGKVEKSIIEESLYYEAYGKHVENEIALFEMLKENNCFDDGYTISSECEIPDEEVRQKYYSSLHDLDLVFNAYCDHIIFNSFDYLIPIGKELGK